MPSAAHFLLEAIVACEVDYLFCNLGTDHAPFIEEMARWRAQGLRLPKIIVCPHENTAVHMAGGYAAATGRGQVVLVHVDAGTANAAMALHNLARARIPVLVMAGRAPYSSHGELPGSRDAYVHFVQDPFDQASIVRPYVKWESTLHSGLVAKELVVRASAVMHSDPMGPAYLMLPREVLAAECEPTSDRAFSPTRYGPVKAGAASANAIHSIALRLLQAQSPLLITAYAGRNPTTVGLITELALLAGVRVCEFNPVHLNIARNAPCFGGFQSAQFAHTTDLGLLVDVDVPWIPKTTQENPDAFWVQIDIDAIKRDFPTWSFPGDLRIEADSALVLTQLIDALKAMATPEFHRLAASRVQLFAREHADRQRTAARQAEDPGTIGSLNPHHVCAAIGRLISEQDIVINEAITNTLAVFEQIPRSEPGSLIGLPGGGLGFSGGMALGQKLARPDRRVIQIVGDGSFYFCNPTSLVAVAQQYRLPILTVVLDNGGWAAVKGATLRMYPQGQAWEQNDFSSRLAPDMDFSLTAQAAGAYGELLVNPEMVEAAIARCLDAVDNGRSALLHVRIAPLGPLSSHAQRAP